MVATHCDACGEPFGISRKRTETVTGRTICDGCAGALRASSASLVGSPGDVGTAIATEGWWRRRRRRKPS